jgi:hypothetical protein
LVKGGNHWSLEFVGTEAEQSSLRRLVVLELVDVGQYSLRPMPAMKERSRRDLEIRG